MTDFTMSDSDQTQQYAENEAQLPQVAASSYVPLPPSQDNIRLHLNPLVVIAHWVVWKLESREGVPKPTKVPYDPTTGRHASVTDSTTWGTFDQAWSAYSTGDYSGVGFVVTEELGIVAIDIDHCVEDGKLDPKVWEIVQALDTYCEWSPSRRGLRLFLYGTLPAGRNKNGQFEAYSSKRYVTVTGCVVEVKNQ